VTKEAERDIATGSAREWLETNEYKAELQKELQDLYEGQLHDWYKLVNATNGIVIDSKERSWCVNIHLIL
jgi:hypothetical protein